MRSSRLLIAVWLGALLTMLSEAGAGVEGQPLGAQLRRVVQAMAYLGSPLSEELSQAIDDAALARDAEALQTLVDPLVLAKVEINPELRVKVVRGDGAANLHS